MRWREGEKSRGECKPEMSKGREEEERDGEGRELRGREIGKIEKGRGKAKGHK